MPQFVFKLQGLLEHRRRLERERQRELALVQKEVANIEKRMRDLDAGLTASNDDMRQNRLTGNVDLAFLAAQRRFILSIRQMGVELVQQLAQQKQAETETRKRLALAARDRKIIEKLREKRFDAWRADLERKQNAELDEIGMQIAFADATEQAEASERADAGAGEGEQKRSRR